MLNRLKSSLKSRSLPRPAMDWLSRLFEMMPVRGRLDLRCFYGAPFLTNVVPSAFGEGSLRTRRFGVPLGQATGGMIRFSRMCWKIALNMSSESMQAWKPATDSSSPAP
jgi:hypothetical protein